MSTIGPELLNLIGPAGYFVLIEQYGGTRFLVPKNVEQSKHLKPLGFDTLTLMSNKYGGETLKIPLDREFLARTYSGQGLSNAKVARKLRMSESGVEYLFHRVGRVDPRQIDMFS